MRWGDYLLQRWRGAEAAKNIRPGDSLLDIGCYDGVFLASVQRKVSISVGVDPIIPKVLQSGIRDRLILSDVTQGLPFPDRSFDVVSLLALFEHLQDKATTIQEISRVLRPGGRVVMTVPGDQVDNVLRMLIAIGVVDGMSLEEHHGFHAQDTLPLFEENGFTLLKWKRFQLGMNNLFVFKKL